MNIRSNYQIACPICLARSGSPCKGKLGERLQGVHFQRTTALRRAKLEVLRTLYAPLHTTASVQGR